MKIFKKINPSISLMVFLLLLQGCGKSGNSESKRELITSSITSTPDDLGNDVRKVTLDLRAIVDQLLSGEDSVAGSLKIQLEDNLSISVNMDKMKRGEGDSLTWLGNVEGYSGSEVIISKVNESLHAKIQFDNELYVIRPAQEGSHFLVHHESLPEMHEDDEVAPTDAAEGLTDAEGLAFSGAHEFVDQRTGLTIVDVMIIYTKQVRELRGGQDGVMAFLNSAIEEANLAYSNSKINVRVRLVHAEESNSSKYQTSDALALLNSLSTDSTVGQLRNNYGADLVSLVVDSLENSCGLGQRNPEQASPNYAFSIIDERCADVDRTFAHEWGHNFGAQHDNKHPASGSSFSFGWGWYLSNARTIMSYADGNFPKITYFSNPDVFYQGERTGSSGANNARVHNIMAPKIAAFRSSKLPLEQQGPKANAGSNQIVDLMSDVNLSAAQSSDVNGDLLSFRWQQVSGPAVTISGANTSTAFFKAIDPGVYEFSILVSDGFFKDSDRIRITVKDPSQANESLIANAGRDLEIYTGNEQFLDGTASVDPNGKPLTYKWEQVRGPALKIFEGQNDKVAKIFTLNDGLYIFRLTISNGEISATDEVIVTAFKIFEKNKGPEAKVANSSISTQTGMTVNLDASRSTDPENNLLSFEWSQLKGPAVSLSSGNSAKASFVPAQEGEYQFRVRVMDRLKLSEAFVNVTVAKENSVNEPKINRAPLVSVASATSVQEGGVGLLDASQSSDPDGDKLQFNWQQISGKNVIVSTATTAKASFNANEPGEYTFKVIVSDGQLSSEAIQKVIVTQKPATVTKPTTRNYAPRAYLPFVIRGDLNQTITLDASRSSDRNGDPLQFTWEQISGPTVNLSSSGSQASFTAIEAGNFKFRVVVSDGHAQADDVVTVRIRAPRMVRKPVSNPPSSFQPVSNPTPSFQPVSQPFSTPRAHTPSRFQVEGFSVQSFFK